MIKKSLPYFKQELTKVAFGLPSKHIPSIRSQIINPGLKSVASSVGGKVHIPITNKISKVEAPTGVV
jgi:hypothetical protein